MKTAVYNQKGENAGEATLPKEIFEVKMNPDLVWQVAVSQAGNRRQILADTKSRGEVSGGGKKPWRQKGTGRSRHGSSRSPIWRHGGITFGPRTEVNYKRDIPAKMKRAALFMVLSAKAKENLIIVLDELKLQAPKTKSMFDILTSLPVNGKSVLVALPAMDNNIILSLRNIPQVKSVQAKDLNCLDALSFKYMILLKDSIKVIKEAFSEKNKKQSAEGKSNNAVS